MIQHMSELRQETAATFGIPVEKVRLVRSPYRVCPLGAHIDHQGGVVTAMAIDRAVWLAYAPTQDSTVTLRSHDFAGEVHFAVDQVPSAVSGDWGNYARGAVCALQDSGQHLRCGIVGMTSGSLGEGGLSSSAAIGVAYLLALEEANELNVSAAQNVDLDQAIENGYLGLRNGILDQSAILLSEREHLTVIDCRRRAHECVPGSGSSPCFLIAFSGLREALVNTDYNRRVDECRAAASTLLAAAGRAGSEPVLGGISADEYAQHAGRLAGAEASRARHFFSEMARVQKGIAAWHRGDLSELGGLMSASGASSIHNYECGAEPLIDLYDILTATPGVLGARFSGAGFRGCCVALVEPAAASVAAEQVMRQYAESQPTLAAQAAPVMICASDDGARLIRTG